MKYKGRKLREISFPLGGIGSGCIGLAGNGGLADWEIFNRPNKGSLNGFSHIAVKAERGGRVLDARVLNGDFQPPYMGRYGKDFGFGPGNGTAAGFPHFSDAEFTGEFPVADICFRDANFPGKAKLLAFNPFIPLNDRDSSIPAAFFEISIRNTEKEALDYTVCFSVKNPFAEKTKNVFWKQEKFCGITMNSGAFPADDPGFGDLTLSTDGDSCSFQESWYRGGWFDAQTVFWQEFSAAGPLRNRACSECGKGDMASLAVRFRTAPGEKRSVRFVLSWNFPNNYNYWNPVKEKDADGKETEKDVTWKNYYAVLFRDSAESGTYSLANWDSLFRETELFRKALYSSTLPASVLDAVGSNLAVLKSPAVLRLPDGSFYGWEGTREKAGSCEGSCTHVWNYAYALPFLFPKLERSMRDLDYTFNQRDDGGMVFRLRLPPGRERWNFRPCADGQFGGAVKMYRDWKISGDDEWLKRRWPQVKKSIEFAWNESNADAWDHDRDGVLEGRQHHTLDMELFGPSSWLEGFYLAALKAGAEMAEAVGDEEAAEQFASLFRRGSRWTEENLFNGEYYQQKIDLRDRSILARFEHPGDIIIGSSSSVLKTYWNDEAKEIKYQIGAGCEIDQVCAQWHANLCGLGDIFRRDRVRLALGALYRNNFLQMRGLCNPCRIFALNDEKGLIICTWPHAEQKPAVPIPYAQECMTGFEYAAAALMIQEGMTREGLEIVKAIRDRYDGEKRNPWNEIECGSNYARSMASYSLLPAASGFSFDLSRGMIGFDPRLRQKKEVFRCFWSLGSGWGIFESRPGKASIRVLYGTLEIREIRLPAFRIGNAEIICGKHRFSCAAECGVIRLDDTVTAAAGQKIIIRSVG